MAVTRSEFVEKLFKVLKENAETLGIKPDAQIIEGEVYVIGVVTADGDDLFFIEVSEA